MGAAGAPSEGPPTPPVASATTPLVPPAPGSYTYQEQRGPAPPPAYASVQPLPTSSYGPIGTHGAPGAEHHSPFERATPLFGAPMTSSLLGPALTSLQGAQRWTEEPFPFAWFLTPVPDFVPPGSLVHVAGYHASAASAGPEASQETPQEAGQKTVGLGTFLCVVAVAIMSFPRFATFLALQAIGTVFVFAGGFLTLFSLPSSISDFVIGFNALIAGLFIVFFPRFGAFLVANILAVWILTKGAFRQCICLSAFAAVLVIIWSIISPNVIGMLLGYDLLLTGLWVVATGRRMALPNPLPAP